MNRAILILALLFILISTNIAGNTVLAFRRFTVSEFYSPAYIVAVLVIIFLIYYRR